MSILSIKAATLTLMRIPITSRFFSKDLILEQIIQKRKITEIVIIIITAILTTSYSIKIIITIKSKKKRSERKERKAKKGEWTLTTVLIITRCIIVNVSERQITLTNTWEKTLWLVIIAAALINKKRNKDKEKKKRYPC